MSTRRSGLRGLGLLAAVLMLVGPAEPATAAEGGSDERLRKRVQRFYVLTYLDRYDELWDVFAPELRAKLGGDRREYVRRARDSGFELYTSRIDAVALMGPTASVEVRLEVRLPGSVELTVRRHRMAWRVEEGDWHYLGSLDVTHAADATLEGADLLPPPHVGQPTYEEPPRSLVPVRPATPPAAHMTPAPSAGSRPGERWDLVAIPPPGSAEPAAVAALEEGAAPDAAQPPVTSASASPAPPRDGPAAAASALVRATADPLLTGPTARDQSGVEAPAVELAALVNRAVESNPAVRNRVLAKLRSRWEPAVAPLMARALPRASAPVAVAFLGEIARYGDGALADACMPLLEHEDPGVRTAAFEALGEIGSALHAEAVVAAAGREPVQRARAAGVLAAGSLGGEGARALVRAILAEASTPGSVLAAAARAAGLLRDADSEELVLGWADRLAPAAAVAAAIDALARLRTPRCLDLLLRLAASSDLLREVAPAREVRLLALRALAVAGDDSAGAGLAAHLLRQGQSASAFDVTLVATAGDSDALLLLLPHPHPAVRRRAADFLSRVAASPEQAERAAAALQSALAEEGDDDTLLALDAARVRLLALLKNESAASP